MEEKDRCKKCVKRDKQVDLKRYCLNLFFDHLADHGLQQEIQETISLDSKFRETILQHLIAYSLIDRLMTDDKITLMED